MDLDLVMDMDLESGCDLNIPEAVEILEMVISIPTFVLGILGNVAVLAGFCCRRGGPWTYMRVYTTNMALADLAVLFSLPFDMYSQWNAWPFSADFCLLLVSLHYVNMYVSIYSAAAFALVCCAAVEFPLQAEWILSPWKAFLVCALAWVLASVLSGGLYAPVAPETNGTRLTCFQVGSRPSLAYVLVLELLGFFLPLAVMAFCSARVVRALARPAAAVAGGDSNSTLDSASRAEGARGVPVMAANTTVVVVCFTPFHLALLLSLAVEALQLGDCVLTKAVSGFAHVSVAVASVNCCLDSVGYYYAIRDSWGRISSCCRSAEHTSADAVV